MKKYTKKYKDNEEERTIERYWAALVIVVLVVFVAVVFTKCEFEESNAEFEKRWADEDMRYPSSIQYDRYNSNFID
jgi:hypothetical protein